MLDELRAQRALSLLDTPEQAQIDAVLLHELHHLSTAISSGLNMPVRCSAVAPNCCSGLGCCLLALRCSSIDGNNVLCSRYPRRSHRYYQHDPSWLGRDDLPQPVRFGRYWDQIAERTRQADFGATSSVAFKTRWRISCIWGQVLLLVIFWQRLIRLREIYADAGVAQIFGDYDLSDAGGVQHDARWTPDRSVTLGNTGCLTSRY